LLRRARMSEGSPIVARFAWSRGCDLSLRSVAYRFHSQHSLMIIFYLNPDGIVSYHSPQAVGGSCPDKDLVVAPAEAVASGVEEGLAAAAVVAAVAVAADLGRVAPGLGCPGWEGWP